MASSRHCTAGGCHSDSRDADPARGDPRGEGDCCAGTDGSPLGRLDDWFWEPVFEAMSVRQRIALERVCRRWYGLLRARRLWRRLALGDEPEFKDKLNKDVLEKLVEHSMGPRVLRPPGHVWPMPAALRSIDLAGCSFRQVSPLKLLDLLASCPVLEYLKLSGLWSNMTDSQLFFHCKDFPYMQRVVQQFGKSLMALEVDLRVQSIWSYESHNRYMDPLWWGQLLAWLKDERSKVKIKVLDVHHLPCDGCFMESVSDYTCNSTVQIELLANAISRNATLSNLVFGSDCCLGDVGASAFLKGVRGNASLAHVGMISNGITPAGASSMAQILRDGLRLSTLDLRGNQIGPDAATSLLATMAVRNGSKDFELKW